jgi:hypothetical protein
MMISTGEIFYFMTNNFYITRRYKWAKYEIQLKKKCLVMTGN